MQHALCLFYSTQYLNIDSVETCILSNIHNNFFFTKVLCLLLCMHCYSKMYLKLDLNITKTSYLYTFFFSSIDLRCRVSTVFYSSRIKQTEREKKCFSHLIYIEALEKEFLLLFVRSYLRKLQSFNLKNVFSFPSLI